MFPIQKDIFLIQMEMFSIQIEISFIYWRQMLIRLCCGREGPAFVNACGTPYISSTKRPPCPVQLFLVFMGESRAASGTY